MNPEITSYIVVGEPIRKEIITTKVTCSDPFKDDQYTINVYSTIWITESGKAIPDHDDTFNKLHFSCHSEDIGINEYKTIYGYEICSITNEYNEIYKTFTIENIQEAKDKYFNETSIHPKIYIVQRILN